MAIEEEIASERQMAHAGCERCADMERSYIKSMNVLEAEAERRAIALVNCQRETEDALASFVQAGKRSKAQAAIIAGLRNAISSALCLVAEGPEVMRSAALRDEVEKVLLSTLKMGDLAALESK